MKGLIKKVKGATSDLDYLIHFDDYAENVSTIEGVLKPFTKTIELYGGNVNERGDITSQAKLSYEITVFNTVEERNEYKQNQIQNTDG